MKKFFAEAEVEVTLISALEDIMLPSANGDAGQYPDEGYENDGGWGA